MNLHHYREKVSEYRHRAEATTDPEVRAAWEAAVGVAEVLFAVCGYRFHDEAIPVMDRAWELGVEHLLHMTCLSTDWLLGPYRSGCTLYHDQADAAHQALGFILAEVEAVLHTYEQVVVDETDLFEEFPRLESDIREQVRPALLFLGDASTVRNLLEVIEAPEKAVLRDFDFEDLETQMRAMPWEPDLWEPETETRGLFLGTVFGLMPSGKYYAFWCSNFCDLEGEADTAYREALEAEAESRGWCLVSGEGDPCDLLVTEYREAGDLTEVI